MLKFVAAGVRTGYNYMKTNGNPATMAELRQNMNLRHQMSLDLLTDVLSLDSRETAAAHQFWAAQACVLIDYLARNNGLLSNVLGLQIDPNVSITKQNLITIIDGMLAVLHGNDNDKKKQLLQPIVTDSQKVQNESKVQGDELANINIRSCDSIAVARTLAAKGQVVMIMDAANAQRPGAGAFKRGTFQEALTRSSDLYWKILADFYNVLEKAVAERRTSLQFAETDLAVDVLSYQARYLALILYFIKQTLQNPRYFDLPAARKEFYEYANQIFSQMQNIVFEIPSNQAFRKNCRLVDLTDIKTTADLFDERGTLNAGVEDRMAGQCYVVEVAAPDCRASEGATDRGCTIDDARRKNSNPDSIIRYSIECVLQAAVEVKADSLILNGFGCEAFRNDPEKVARIFSEVLARYQNQLKGKHIHFIDLKPEMCMIFGRIFNESLGSIFSFNMIAMSGVKLEVKPGPIKEIPANSAVFAPTPKVAATYLRQGAIMEGHVFCPEECKEDTVISLRNEFIDLFLKAVDKQDVTTIHLPLLGSGNRGFHPCDSLQALATAIEYVSARFPRLKTMTVKLYIPEDDKFRTAINWLMKDRQPDRKRELAKYYTLVTPDWERRKNFGGGLFMTHYRTATKDNWARWTRITNKLYLGKIPTCEEANELHRDIPGLKLVVSCVEDFESAGVGFSYLTPSIQTAADWKKLQVDNHQVVVKDGHADDFPQLVIARTVGKILDTINKNQTVYIHCKAGRSRSATLVALTLYFLLKQDGENPDIGLIHDYLKSVRQEVSLRSIEIANIKSVIQLIESNPQLLQAEPHYHQLPSAAIDQPLQAHIATYLTSDKGKADISQLPAFKNLKCNAIRNLKDLPWTQNLLSDIYGSTNGAWLAMTYHDDNPYVTALRKEVVELLSQQLNVAVDLIMITAFANASSSPQVTLRK